MSHDVMAAILAGGLGTRLRSVVSDRPKALAIVRGRPFIEYLLDQLVDAGFKHIVLLVGYRAELVRATLGFTYRGMSLSYSEERMALGTGGAIANARHLLNADQVVVLNGDSYCDCNLKPVQTKPTLVVARVADVGRYGDVSLDSTNRVISFGEKSGIRRSGWINAGIYHLPRMLLDSIPTDRPISIERDVFPAWVESGLLYGERSTGRFLDIGTPESLAQADLFFHEARHAA